MKYYDFKVDPKIEWKRMEARDVIFAQPAGDIVMQRVGKEGITNFNQIM